MINEACDTVREFLIDSRGARDGMASGMRDHLATCKDCREFAALMEGLAWNEGEAAPMDYRAIDDAFAEAAKIERNRKDLIQFIGFLGAACAILAAVFYACASGYALPFLTAQIAAFIALPFLGLIAIARRLKGEFEWIP